MYQALHGALFRHNRTQSSLKGDQVGTVTISVLHGRTLQRLPV